MVGTIKEEQLVLVILGIDVGDDLVDVVLLDVEGLGWWKLGSEDPHLQLLRRPKKNPT